MQLNQNLIESIYVSIYEFIQEIVNDSQTFFRAKAVLNKEAFLDTDPAKPYQDVFR